MPTVSCAECATAVDLVDNFCCYCGLPQAAAGSASRLSPPSNALTVREAEVLSTLRMELAPLVPSLARAVAVLGAAAVADWVLREGSRHLLREGLILLGRRAALNRAERRNQRGAAEQHATVVMEQRIAFHN